MASDAELGDICKLLHIGDSSNPLEEAAAYIKTAKLCFLCAKMEMMEPRSSVAREWIQKGFHCCGKNYQKFDEKNKEDLADIGDWIKNNIDPYLLKDACKCLDEHPPCMATILAYRALAVLMKNQALAVIRRDGVKLAGNDYNACLPWFNECLEAGGRCLNLCNLLQVSKDFSNEVRVINRIADLYSITMKACIQIVDSGEYIEDDNASLLEWKFRSKEIFRYLRDMSYRDPISDETALLDLIRTFNAAPDALQFLKKTFNCLRGMKELFSVFRRNRQRQESRRPEETDEEILIRLGENIKALRKEAEKSSESYLRFVYANHPHPNSEWRLGKISTQEETSEALQKAIRHYHPDTNMRYGREWVFLCTEITKILNNKHSNR